MVAIMREWWYVPGASTMRRLRSGWLKSASSRSFMGVTREKNDSKNGRRPRAITAEIRPLMAVHRTPQKKSLENSPWNMVTARREANWKKGTHTPQRTKSLCVRTAPAEAVPASPPKKAGRKQRDFV